MKSTSRRSVLKLQRRIVLTVVYYFILLLPILPVFSIGHWGPPFISRMGVVRIVADGQLLYARSIEVRIMNRYTQSIHVSRDRGRTWSEHGSRWSGTWIEFDTGWDWKSQKNPSEARFPRGLDEDVLLLSMTCMEISNETCFRIDGRQLIERSDDAGMTWREWWRVPTERRSYARRITSLPSPERFVRNKGYTYLPTIYDILPLEHETGATLIVAMGTEGIVRLDVELGVAERVAVEQATPTTWNTSSPRVAIGMTRPEWLVAMLFGLILASIRSSIVLSTLVNRAPGIVRWLSAATVTWLLIVALAYSLVPLTKDITLSGLTNWGDLSFGLLAFGWLGLVVGPPIVFVSHFTIGPVFHASRISAMPDGTDITVWRAERKRAAVTVFVISAVASAAFASWALGWIPSYSTAAAVTAVSVLWGLSRIAAVVRAGT